MPGDNIKAASLQSFVVTAGSPQHCLLVAGLSLLHGGNNQSQETASELPDVSSELPSWRWWTARVLSVNQRLLARSAASLRSALQTVMPQVHMHAISMHALPHAASPRHSSPHPLCPDQVLMPETKVHIPVMQHLWQCLTWQHSTMCKQYGFASESGFSAQVFCRGCAFYNIALGTLAPCGHQLPPFKLLQAVEDY